jgi:hypothetical protein
MGLRISWSSGWAQKACSVIGVAAFASLVAAAAAAANDDDRYRLVWIRGANAGQCPEQAVIERQVQLRLDRDPFEPDANHIIHVLVSSDGASWHVRLVVQDNTGKALGQRVLDVSADNCGEVVTAVGLAIALAIDPNVSLEAKPPDATSAAAAVAREAQPTWHARPAANDLSAPDQHPPETQMPNASVLAVDRDPYQYELTLRAVGTSGVLPRFAGGTSVAGSFGRKGARLMLALTYLPESTRDTRFSFGFAAASGGGCGDIVRLRLLATSVCGEFALGAIHSVVHQLEPLHPGDRLTAAIGLGPKIGWHAWAPLFFEVGASAWVGLVRPKFSLVDADSSRTTVFQSQAVWGTGFVGVGVTAP